MNKKKIIFVCLLAIVFSYFLFILNKDTSITNYPPKNNKIVAFGDSLVEGVGSSLNQDFVSVIERNLNTEIINLGRSGDTTSSALLRLDNVLSLDPGTVLVLLGGNDVLRRHPQTETFKNLETIITKLQENGSVVILLGVRGGILSDKYEDDFQNLAQKYKTGYVSNVLDDIILNRELMYDGIHPNDKGYKIIADRVTPILEKILK